MNFPLSLAFWLLAIGLIAVFVATVIKSGVSSTKNENRAQILQELGPDALNIRQPSFVGFFHPYW